MLNKFPLHALKFTEYLSLQNTKYILTNFYSHSLLFKNTLVCIPYKILNITCKDPHKVPFKNV